MIKILSYHRKFHITPSTPNSFNHLSTKAGLWSNVSWWKWVIMMSFFLTKSNYTTHRMISYSFYCTKKLFWMIFFWNFVNFVHFYCKFRHVIPWNSIISVTSSKSNYILLNIIKIWIYRALWALDCSRFDDKRVDLVDGSVTANWAPECLKIE